jgi:hypothetical protein
MRIVFDLSNLEGAASYLMEKDIERFPDTFKAKEYIYEHVRAADLLNKETEKERSEPFPIYKGMFALPHELTTHNHPHEPTLWVNLYRYLHKEGVKRTDMEMPNPAAQDTQNFEQSKVETETDSLSALKESPLSSNDYPGLLRGALANKDHFDGGRNSAVFNTQHPSYVVKIYKCQHDFELVKAMQGDPHYPTILYEESYPNDSAWRAVLTDRLKTWGPYTQEISDFINSNGRHQAVSLAVASDAVITKRLRTPYPASLGHSLRKLYEYFVSKGPEFETDLNQPSNWGVRTDGTPVMLDPLYYNP